jgi:hypothetical protein
MYYLSMVVDCRVYPIQVHIQITISRYSYIDYSHEFVGSALARFERSTLPDHIGTRTVVLRFLKIITPVKCVMPLYDGYIYCPKEGELFRRTYKYRRDQRVWSVNIDKTGTTIPKPFIGQPPSFGHFKFLTQYCFH